MVVGPVVVAVVVVVPPVVAVAVVVGVGPVVVVAVVVGVWSGWHTSTSSFPSAFSFGARRFEALHLRSWCGCKTWPWFWHGSGGSCGPGLGHLWIDKGGIFC